MGDIEAITQSFKPKLGRQLAMADTFFRGGKNLTGTRCVRKRTANSTFRPHPFRISAV